MEKLIYLLEKPAEVGIEAYREQLLTSVTSACRAEGARQITLNIADMSEWIQQEAPGRLIGPWQRVSAVLAFWHECLDARGPIEDSLHTSSPRLSGYLVTESVLQSFEPEWEGGERRPGITQFGANGKPEKVSLEAFYHNWQVLHSAQSFELHPRRWSYVRNAVARTLTTGAPEYLAIVSEHFRELEDFTVDERYFGSQDAVNTMIEHLPGFCDLNNMVSVPMSEYYFA
ncbi:MAG: hypothetical protein AAGA91_01455 [Pseudomonadota bacterium]